MHAGSGKLCRNLFHLVLRNSDVESTDNVCSLSGESTSEVEIDGSVVVALSLLDLGSLGLLIGLKKPLEIVLLELLDVRVVLLLGDLDTLIPSV